MATFPGDGAPPFFGTEDGEKQGCYRYRPASVASRLTSGRQFRV
jgi:hypothetical protein